MRKPEMCGVWFPIGSYLSALGAWFPVDVRETPSDLQPSQRPKEQPNTKETQI